MKVLVVFASLVAVALAAPHAVAPPATTEIKEAASADTAAPAKPAEAPAAVPAPAFDVVAVPLESAESVPQQVVVAPDALAPVTEAAAKVTAAPPPTIEKAPIESGKTAAVPVFVATEGAPAPAIVVEAPKTELVDPIAQAAAIPLKPLSQVVEKATVTSEAIEAAPVQKVTVDTIATTEAVPAAIVPAQAATPSEKKDTVEVSKAEVSKEDEVKKVEVKTEEPFTLTSEATIVAKVTEEVKVTEAPIKEPKPLGV